jgi:dTDP-4-dehydrorhamnose reductase
LRGMSPPIEKLEIWGGLECTLNRVGEQYFDQLSYNGHDSRLSDLDRFAEIGLKTLRYPFLWERTAPQGPASADWSWTDLRTKKLRELGIRTIAGLVHHGSGPRYTDLLDPLFGEKLAEYALAFATRYPWIEDYTPINEQCTTARFSGLYGFWYPHRRDLRSFFRMLLNECRATVLAMLAIRRVQQNARLIQTDDLGQITASPSLRYQADHENERRWLGFDLLCGRVTREHPFWELLIRSKVSERELNWFAENPCPPEIIGLNHYFLSNRHLDARVENYPVERRGGNGRHKYADVETVRIADQVSLPAAELYRQAWERYHIPIAATEVHADASREDQVRWLMQIWRSAERLRSEGVDIRAVTSWGLLGHYDWHCLVTRCEGHYEPGAFDVRGPEPRPTLVAKAVQALSRTGDFQHPTLGTPGWWERDVRALFPIQKRPPRPFAAGSFEVTASPGIAQPLLVIGRNGTLGQAFANVCELRGIRYRLVSRQEFDICDTARLESRLLAINPWAVINAAGYVRVDAAEQEEDRCRRENVEGPTELARLCARYQLPYVTFSSDLVFDGGTATPYRESSAVSPLNVYGRTKAEAERGVLSAYSEALVVRTSAFFGPWDNHNFVTACLRHLESGNRFDVLSDVKVSPTYVPDLAQTTLDLMLDGESGIWNLANSGEVTWADLAMEIADRSGLNRKAIVLRRLRDLNLPAQRPYYSVLSSERAVLLPTLEVALQRYFEYK